MRRTSGTRSDPATSIAQAPVGTTSAATGREVWADAPRAGERVLTRQCRHCGQPFEVVHDLQAFCRPSCRRAHGKADTPRAVPFADLDDPVSARAVNDE